jgi:hypothetical protein
MTTGLFLKGEAPFATWLRRAVRHNFSTTPAASFEECGSLWPQHIEKVTTKHFASPTTMGYDQAIWIPQ